MNKFVLPLVGFVGLATLLAVGLRLNPREVPSPLIGKSAPAFEIAQLHAPEKTFSPESMKGKVWMLNVWASWCVSCRQEHPVLVEYVKSPGAVPVIGLNHKDQREDGQRWLAQFGDPYTLSAYDIDGRVGINYGVYGVPETYLIDKSGVIRFKQIGPVTPQVLAEKIKPLIQELSS
jgi:cytochrome c biogenesis protein CcmG, thiol:disulfide interchange protein DsbE